MTVVGRQGVGSKASVVVVDVDGTRFVLGVTEHAVNVLQSGDRPVDLEAEVTQLNPVRRTFAKPHLEARCTADRNNQQTERTTRTRPRRRTRRAVNTPGRMPNI